MPAGAYCAERKREREQLLRDEVWRNGGKRGRYRICDTGGRCVGVDVNGVRKGERWGKKSGERKMEERRGESGKRKGGRGSEFPSVPRKRQVEVKEEASKKKRARAERVSREAQQEKRETTRKESEVWNGKPRRGTGAQSPTSVLDMHCSPKVDRQGCVVRSGAVENEGSKRSSVFTQVALRRCAPQDEREIKRRARDEGVKKRWELEELERESEGATTDGIWLESMPKAKNVACSDSRIHGTGLFAMERIRAGEFVIEYGGKRWEKGSVERLQAEYMREGINESYIFELPDGSVIDGTLSESLARYINHSCDANVCAHDVWVEGEYRVLLYALRDVEEREEVTCDYRFELEEEAKKIACLCGARRCQKFLNYDPDGFRTKAMKE